MVTMVECYNHQKFKLDSPSPNFIPLIFLTSLLTDLKFSDNRHEHSVVRLDDSTVILVHILYFFSNLRD